MAVSVFLIAAVAGLSILLIFVVVAVFIAKKMTKKASKQPEICLTLPRHIPTTINYTCPGHKRLSNGEIDLDLLDPDLYQDMNDFEQKTIVEPSAQGRLCFNVEYEEEMEKLVILVICAQNIRPKTSNPTAMPYVKICLLPDKRTKVQTKPRQKTPNPIFNEEFVFHCPISDLRKRCLKFTVCDFDRFSRQSVIGTVLFPLNVNYDRILTNKSCKEEWRFIEDFGSEITCFGSILFSLQYLPTAKRLAIVILKGKCLKWDTNNPSMCVKITMISGGKTTSRKKTTKKADFDAVFNESFHFDVPENCLDRTSLIVAVINNNKLVGRVVVGPNLYATGTGLTHWIDMENSPRNAVAMWHSIIR